MITGILDFVMIGLAVLPLLMIIINLFYYQRPAKRLFEKNILKISVLIPARDEAFIIADSVVAVLKSRDIDIELIVLDDHSSDATAEIVNGIALQDPRLRVLKAPPLPHGWCGKQHACFQLAKHAKHQILLFIDADVILQPNAIADTLAVLQAENLDALSGVPYQITGTLGEKLIIPLIHFILLGFLPMFMPTSRSDPAFAAGCGQFMMIRTQAYWAINGHASIFSSWHDGIHLPKQLRLSGFQTGLADLTELCTCRMYQSFRQVWQGFSKNATDGMAGKQSIIIWTLLLGLGQCLPLFWITHPAASAALLCGFTARIILARRFRQSWISVLLHPLGILLLLLIQWYSWVQARLGKSVHWKGRGKTIISDF